MATGTLTNYSGTIELPQRTGTTITLNTEKKYIPNNISLTLNAPIATPTLTGGAPSGTATIGSTTNCTISGTNTSGISITTGGTCSRAKLTYNGAIDGWVTASNGATPNGAAASNAVNLTTETKYLTGVELTKPVSGTRSFQITVPNGSSGTVTFTFSVDSNGNTTII